MAKQTRGLSEASREPLASRLRRALVIAAAAGPLLTLVYQGRELWAGEVPVLWQTALTFAVPFCVAMVVLSLSGLARRSGAAASLRKPAPRRQDRGPAAAAGQPDDSGALGQVRQRLDETARIVAQIRGNSPDGRNASPAGILLIEGPSGGTPAAGETIGAMSQAIGEAVAAVERTTSEAAEQVVQFQTLIERLDRVKRNTLRVT